MDKKKFIAAVILASLLVGMQGYEVAIANFFIPPYNTRITVTSPRNVVYKATTVDLSFFLETDGLGSYCYGLDDGCLFIINVTTVSQEHIPGGNETAFHYIRQGSTSLSNLTTGVHTVKVVEIDAENKPHTLVIQGFNIDPYYNESSNLTPTIAIAAGLVVAVAVVITLLVYLRKRRGKPMA